MEELKVLRTAFSQMTDESLDAAIEAAQEEKKNRRATRAKELWDKLNNVFDEIAKAGFRVTSGWNSFAADDFEIEDKEDD